MNDQDRQALKEFLDGLSEYYSTDKKSTVSVQIYFNALKQYTMQEIMSAASQHLQDPKSGQFFPKVADFVRYLKPQFNIADLKPDDVLAMAVEAVTPLGVLARIKIGTWTLFNEIDPFVRRQSALIFLESLPETHERAKLGLFTPHEVATMQKLKVSPKSPLYRGESPPSSEALNNIKRVYHENKDKPEYLVWSGQSDDQEYAESICDMKALPSPSDEEVADVRDKYSGLGEGKGFDFEKRGSRNDKNGHGE